MPKVRAPGDATTARRESAEPPADGVRGSLERLRLSVGLGLGLTALAFSIRSGPKESAAASPSAVVAPDLAEAVPISMKDLQQLEHLAWLVDTRSVEEEAYLEAKFAILHRPMPDGVVGPVPHLILPTDELGALERLRASGHLSDAEYETLRRRVLLRI
jgi:hypothetical protein